MKTSISRRAFTGLLLGLLAAWPPWLRAAAARPDGPTLAARRLVELLGDEQGAARIGRLYLDKRPAERDPALLTALLLGPRLHWDADPAALRAGLRRSRRRDYGRGDTVTLGGCIVSRTEARLCALAALVNA